MNRKIAKFIVENITQLNNIIMGGGAGTFVKIGGNNPDSVIISDEIIAHFNAILSTIEAFANGAVIEYYCEANNAWLDIETPTFAKLYQYRIKPEPRKFIIALNKNGQPFGVWAACHERHIRKTLSHLDQIIKVQEI